jgi:polysaccharide deacetylase 2 family uncharacterized protein YibQ
VPRVEPSPRPIPRARRPGRIVGVAVLAGALVTAAGASVQLLQGAEPRSSSIDDALDGVFAETGVDRGELSGRVTADDAELTLTVPDDETYARMNVEITGAVRGAGASVLEAVERGRDPDSPDLLEMKLGSGEAVSHRVRIVGAPVANEAAEPPATGPARIALVFDDLGYTTDGLARELLELPAIVTFAVLPGLRASRAFAESASARGHEIILHLPLEPVDVERHDPGRDALFVDLDAREKHRRLGAFLDGLPAYRGVSNHMGSRFSSDPGSVEWLLREVQRRDQSLFFLDSKTTPYSVIPERARALGVPCLSNNLFLDGIVPSRVDPAVQARRLRGIADRRGHAIGIGHVRRETVDAVRDAIPRWEAEGIRLVGLSELVHPDR